MLCLKGLEMNFETSSKGALKDSYSDSGEGSEVTDEDFLLMKNYVYTRALNAEKFEISWLFKSHIFKMNSGPFNNNVFY